MTKQEQVLEFILRHDYIDTASIINYGLKNHFTSAERTARRLAEQGYIKRMTKEEQKEKFPNIRKQKVWKVTRKEIK